MYKLTEEFLKKESRRRILEEKEIQENFYRISLRSGLVEDAKINAKNLFLIEEQLSKFIEVLGGDNFIPKEMEGVFIKDNTTNLKKCTECKNFLNIDFPNVLITERKEGKRSKFLTWDCIKCNSILISQQTT